MAGRGRPTTKPEHNAIYNPTRTSATVATPLLHTLDSPGVGLPHSNDTAYEMSDVEDSTANPTAGAVGADTGDVGAFYAEISSLQDGLKTFNSNIARIDNLHSQSLNNTEDAVSQRSAALLAELVEETSELSVLSATLKQRIQTLERQPSRERDVGVRIQQIALIKSRFVDTIQNYKQMEERYRQRYKLRMEQQFKIVKPDATPEEIRAVVNDESGGQIISQALTDLNSHGDSRAAYREVQARHQDIQRNEQTIAELTQLFNDMNIMVEPQREAIAIETTALTFERDLEAEPARASMPVVSARVRTMKRRRIYIIIGIVIVIVIIIVIVVSVVKSTQP